MASAESRAATTPEGEALLVERERHQNKNLQAHGAKKQRSCNELLRPERYDLGRLLGVHIDLYLCTCLFPWKHRLDMASCWIILLHQQRCFMTWIVMVANSVYMTPRTSRSQHVHSFPTDTSPHNSYSQSNWSAETPLQNAMHVLCAWRLRQTCGLEETSNRLSLIADRTHKVKVKSCRSKHVLNGC